MPPLCFRQHLIALAGSSQLDNLQYTSIPSVQHECRAARSTHDAVERAALDAIEGVEETHVEQPWIAQTTVNQRVPNGMQDEVFTRPRCRVRAGLL